MESSRPVRTSHQAGASVKRVTAETRAVGLFERAVLPHLDDARTVARCLLDDECDAQDALQDALVRAIRYYGSGVNDVRAWFFTIVRRCCYALRSRRKTDLANVPADILEIRDPAPGPEADAAESIVRDAVAAAIDALPARHREMVKLRELQDLSYDEISRIAGLPVGTVMSRLSRARRRLQRDLAYLVDADRSLAGRGADAESETVS
jgi:RNA polymerase sigma-70 factor, ECF subfamily